MFKEILLPIDLMAGEHTWGKVVETAKKLAEAFDSVIHVMTVVPDQGMSIVAQYFNKSAVEDLIESTNKALHEFVDNHISEDVYKVQHIVTTGSVYESIIDTAKEINADLIIMSAHRPELRDYLLGPNAARVVRHSDRSVLVVRD